jgi:uncharacterized membrane protein YdbT with pleckstrin-like domain
VTWTNYYFDLWIVTNKRIIDVEQKGLFRREVSSLRLDNIQNIVIDMNGIMPTLLRYGNVHVHTAGASHEIFIIRTANDPEHIKNIITEAQNKVLAHGKGSII